MQTRTLMQEIQDRSNGWKHLDDCPLNPCTCNMVKFLDSLEAETRLKLEPTYNITTWMNDKHLEFMKPIEDPFVNTTVFISWKDLLKSLVKYRGLKVCVVVDGNKDAQFKFFRGDRISSGNVLTE